MFKDNPAANAVLVVAVIVVITAGGYWFVTRIKSGPYRRSYQPLEYKSTKSKPIVDRHMVQNEQLRGYGAPVAPKPSQISSWDHNFLDPANPLSPVGPFSPANPLNQSFEPAYEGHGHHTSYEPDISDHHRHGHNTSCEPSIIDHGHDSGSSYDSSGSYDSGSSDSGSGSCD